MPNEGNNPNPTPEVDPNNNPANTPADKNDGGNNGGNTGNTPEVDESAIIKAYLEKKGINEADLQKYVDNANKQKNENPDAKYQKELQSMAIENYALKNQADLGYDAKSLEIVLAMAEKMNLLSDIHGADGKMNEDKLKEAFKNVVDKYPKLKANTDGNEGMVQVGAKGNNNNGSDNGNKSKKVIASKKWNTFNH